MACLPSRMALPTFLQPADLVVGTGCAPHGSYEANSIATRSGSVLVSHPAQSRACHHRAGDGPAMQGRTMQPLERHREGRRQPLRLREDWRGASHTCAAHGRFGTAAAPAFPARLRRPYCLSGPAVSSRARSAPRRPGRQALAPLSWCGATGNCTILRTGARCVRRRASVGRPSSSVSSKRAADRPICPLVGPSSSGPAWSSLAAAARTAG